MSNTINLSKLNELEQTLTDPPYRYSGTYIFDTNSNDFTLNNIINQINNGYIPIIQYYDGRYNRIYVGYWNNYRAISYDDFKGYEVSFIVLHYSTYKELVFHSSNLNDKLEEEET